MINGAGGRESDRHDSPAKPKVVVDQAVLVDSTQAVTDSPWWRPGAVSMNPPQNARGVYGITVAADLVGLGVQTLRLYESRGLLQPHRTGGGTRQYNPNDIHRLRRISVLQDEGINLAGIAMVLDPQDQNSQLRALHKQHQP